MTSKDKIDSHNIGLVTVLNDDFLIGAEMMVYSFLQHNSWFKGEVILLVETPKPELAERFKFVNHLKIEPVSSVLLDKVDALCQKNKAFCYNRPAFFVLEMFRMETYQQLLYVDADVIFQGDVMSLFENPEPFTAVRDGISYQDGCRKINSYSTTQPNPSDLKPEERWFNTFNSGLFVVHQSLINQKIYTDLINLIEVETYEKFGGSLDDQFLLNIYFKDQYKHISGIFNYRMQIGKEMKKKDEFSFQEVKVLHFTGTIKPWHFFKWHRAFTNTEYLHAYQQWHVKRLMYLRRNHQLKWQESFKHAKQYLQSFSFSEKYEPVPVFCFFIGYPRSGHTLIGALLDAHPNAVIATELDVFDLKKRGYSEKKIATLLIKRSSEMRKKNYIWTDYSYEVPGQYQGKYTDLKVMGEKHAGELGNLLEARPDLLDDFKGLGKDLKLIHINRNPFDIITTRVNRQEKIRGQRMHRAEIISLINNQFDKVKVVQNLKIAQKYPIYDLTNEAFIANPKLELKALCEYLGLRPDEQYLEDCSKIVFAKPTATRYKVDWWDEELKALVQTNMQQYDFLKNYSF